jgi:hypothetical protein
MHKLFKKFYPQSNIFRQNLYLITKNNLLFKLVNKSFFKKTNFLLKRDKDYYSIHNYKLF